ncbi:ABC transporter permease [Poriferisphaera sp. WC338]|uniref:ABC transporter permease n=1 Tax=Poriferisphaera sp. WC338 TaxID=3425129 RepID=UPI003D818381
MPDSLRKLVWPLVALAMLLVFNAIVNPALFTFQIVDGRLTGSLIDVLDRTAPVLLISLGMTLVIATAGVDLSVGAVMAMAGSIAAVLLVQYEYSLPMVIAITLLICIFAGSWNGFLVSVMGIQPIVATLILMVAGRGIAQLVSGGQIITIPEGSAFAFIGGGNFLGLPITITIGFVAILITIVLVRFTALGLFIESIGGNEKASYYAGLNVRTVRIFVYAFTAFCAGISGLIYTADITAADANNAGLYLELDAILAVVIGGTSLMGGRFFIAGTIVGVLIIQTLNTTILMTQFGGHNIPAEWNLIVKSVVVLVVCLLQANVLDYIKIKRRAVA